MTVTPEQRARLADLVREMIRDRGARVADWPADEAAAYRDNDGFAEGNAAAEAVRIEKGVQAIAAVIDAALRDAEAERDEARKGERAWAAGYASQHALLKTHEEALREAAATIARVRELHRPVTGIHGDTVCAHRYCVDGALDQCAYPCPTIRALDGTETKEAPASEPTIDQHRCPRCASGAWVGYGMWPGSGPVKAQCVPCGRVYDHPTPEGDPMTTLYRPVLIESAEQAEKLPPGTQRLNNGRQGLAVGWTALVPVKAEEEHDTDCVDVPGGRPIRRLVTRWEDA